MLDWAGSARRATFDMPSGDWNFGFFKRAEKLDSAFQKSLPLSPPAAAKGGKSQGKSLRWCDKNQRIHDFTPSSKNHVVWMRDAGLATWQIPVVFSNSPGFQWGRVRRRAVQIAQPAHHLKRSRPRLTWRRPATARREDKLSAFGRISRCQTAVGRPAAEENASTRLAYLPVCTGTVVPELWAGFNDYSWPGAVKTGAVSFQPSADSGWQ